MKKQILNKALFETEKNQMLAEYGVRKPRGVPQEPIFPPSDAEAGPQYEDEIASERHIQILKKTEEKMAAAKASNEPMPEYEFVWRKQDQPGKRRKPFRPPSEESNENDFYYGQRGGAYRDENDVKSDSPELWIGEEQRDMSGATRAKPRSSTEIPKQLSRKEKEWLEKGNKFEPILVIYGPEHFTRHAVRHRGSGKMIQLEDGVVVDGLRDDEDIPEMVLTPLEIALNIERQMFEDDKF